MTDQDDTYEVYHIPKGALLPPAVWWFTYDPSVYHEPDSFMPERYLDPYNEPDPQTFAFGFGRSICPGRLLVDSNIFLTIAKSLAAFDISRATDEQSEEIDQRVEFTAGLLSYPLPFGCRITTRSKEHEEMIKRVEVEYPGEGKERSLLETVNH